MHAGSAFWPICWPMFAGIFAGLFVGNNMYASAGDPSRKGGGPGGGGCCAGVGKLSHNRAAPLEHNENASMR